MKKTRIITAILTMSIIATHTIGIIPGNMSTAETGQLTAYAYTENVAGTWIKNNKTGKWWYKHTDGSYTTNNWEKIKNVWYHFDKDGWMQTGWLQIGDKWYYLNPSGAMQTGWKEINDKWYYFDSNGVMATGWLEYKGKWYYLDSNGAMLTGWLEYKGKSYYLLNDGAMMIGLLELDDGVYYFGEDGALINPVKYDGSEEYTVTAKSGVNVRSSRSTANSSNIKGVALYGKDCMITKIVDGWGYTEAINCTNGRQAGWIYMENMTKGWPCRIIASSLNLRQNPGSTAASNKVLTTIPKNTVVVISDIKYYDNGSAWIKTTYNGKKGWICFYNSDGVYGQCISDLGRD